MMKVFILKKSILVLFFTALLLAESLYAQLDTNAPWPMFRQNVRHTGQTNKNVLGTQKNPEAKWKCELGDSSYIYYSSPAIGADGTIYIGSLDDKLYAVTNGEVKWSYPTTGDIYSSPAIGADGTIYVGSYDNKLHAINADGTPKWEWITSGFIYSSPAVGTDGTVYVGSYDDKLYAITNGKIKWTNRLGGDIYSSPAIGIDNTIYIGCYNDDKLYAITNGKIKWTNKLGGNIYSSPAIGIDNTIYIGCYDSKLYAITNGKIKWTNKLGSYIYHSSPAIGADGTIYIGCTDDKLYAINADGSLKWTNRLGSDIYSSPAVGSDNTVYIGCSDNKLYAITNGSIKWTYTTGDKIYSSPAIGSDGRIYIGNYEGDIYAIGENHAPELLWSGNVGYINDGVKPNTNIGGTYFRFEVKYKDADNDYPITNQVWIDIDDNDTYDESEKFTVYSNSGSSYSNGILYTNTKAIYYVGDGVINYKFYFKDKYDYIPLPSAPVSNHTFTVTNISYTSILGWTGELGFIFDGINPNTNTGGTNFIFRVSYTNLNDIAPTINQVWIDKNDNGEYNISERFDMIEDDISDSDYTDGKIYTFTNLIAYNGDGILNYKFNFADNISYSAGKPTSNHIFRIIRTNIYYVKTNGNDGLLGTSWAQAWRTIQKAASSTIAGDTTYISNGTYTESVTLPNSGAVGSPITFQNYQSNKVIVDADFNSSSVFNLTDDKNYIRIIGLEIIQGINYGIYIYRSSYTYISGCRFVQDSSGIYINGNASHFSSYGIITNCYFTNNTQGIYFYNYNRYNKVKDNKFIRNQHGIRFLCTATGWDTCFRNTIKSNYICRNTQRGVTTETTGRYHKFLNNTINSNNWQGIYFRDSRYTTYSNNTIIGNGQDGILINNWDDHTSYFYRNTIAKNLYGIRIDASSYNSCKFKYNTIYSNNLGGIYIASSFNTIISNEIYGLNQNYGVNINNGDYNTIQSNILHHNEQNGIYMDGSAVGNKIIRNNILSNNNYGIWINSDTSDNNKIMTNNIYGLNQDYGICISSGDNNIVQSNYLHHNEIGGISFLGSASSNMVYNNLIYSNDQYGIIVNGITAFTNQIYSNQIYGFNQDYGVMLSNTIIQDIRDNDIFQNEYAGISCISSTDALIKYNDIHSNPVGVFYDNSFLSIYLNNITNNNYGIVYKNGDFKNFSKNNLYPNNLYSFSNTSGTPVQITNNWWGSTIASSIQSNIYGMTGYSNFTPYRLFGSFDITPGEDTDSPDRIDNLLSTVSEATVKLVWNKSINSDFIRYSLYCSEIPGFTNFQRSDVITNIYNVNITNYNDICGNGTWYYTVTALDNKFQYTNESWYAKVTNATVFLTTTISIAKSISNISLNQIDSAAVPGSTITYKIGYSNIGIYPGDDIVIYDQIMPNLTFNTEGGGTGIGWSFEYSTNLNPDQNYDSTAYTQGDPMDKEKVKWVRWKKSSVTVDEDGYTLVFKVVIK